MLKTIFSKNNKNIITENVKRKKMNCKIKPDLLQVHIDGLEATMETATASDEVLDDSEAENRIKGKLIVVPWKHSAEFIETFQWLYGESANTESHQKANKQMKIWIARRHNLTPAAVLGTQVLLDVMLKELNSLYSEEDLQNFYSFAVVRFFNFMSSTLQKHKMRSMYDIAVELGLNSHIVDLRHYCAHGISLPSIGVLRFTAKYCMEWLKDYYWLAQKNDLHTVNAKMMLPKNSSGNGIRVSRMFAIYDIALKCYLEDAVNFGDVERILSTDRSLQKIKQLYVKHNLQSLRIIFDALVVELIALHKKMMEKFCEEIYIHSFLDMQYLLTVSEKCKAQVNVHENIIKITQSLFQMFASFGYLEELISQLLKIANNNWLENTKRAGASFWAVQILTGYASFRAVKSALELEQWKNGDVRKLDFNEFKRKILPKQVTKAFIEAGVNLKRTLLVGESVVHPKIWEYGDAWFEIYLDNVNEFTISILKELVQCLHYLFASSRDIKTFHELLKKMEVNASNRQINMTSKNYGNGVIYTAEHLKSLLKNIGNVSKKQSALGAMSPITVNEFVIYINRKRKNEQVEDSYVHYGSFKRPKDSILDWTTFPLGWEPCE